MLVVVYEFVWVIGIGFMFFVEDVVEMYVVICVIVGLDVCIFYGGLVKLLNVVELLYVVNVDGVLVGGVSLMVVDFLLIIFVV